MVAAIVGILEIQGGSPVVREVLGHLTGRAGGPLPDIAFHGDVEGVTADNVVDVGRWQGTGLTGRIETLEGQGRAGEAKTSLDEREEREARGERRLHLGL